MVYDAHKVILQDDVQVYKTPPYSGGCHQYFNHVIILISVIKTLALRSVMLEADVYSDNSWVLTVSLKVKERKTNNCWNSDMTQSLKAEIKTYQPS